MHCALKFNTLKVCSGVTSRLLWSLEPDCYYCNFIHIASLLLVCGFVRGAVVSDLLLFRFIKEPSSVDVKVVYK